MIFDNELLDGLLEKAAQNERLRTNLDLRNSPDDESQRMLNALMPGTVVPVHKHDDTSETIMALRGRAEEIFYDAEGRETARFLLDPAEGKYGIQVPAGQLHTIVAYVPTVIVEFKAGRYK
ncbi:MAG: WbuC family cupin fold metalloprotein [Bacteroidales bacterium]|nr:WbuC family cupin fold metalloprotein [Bacteroidales bacterium]